MASEIPCATGCSRPARIDKNGYQHTRCKTCYNRHHRRRRYGVNGRTYTTTYRKRRKKWIVGKTCELCGATDNLTVDHIVALCDDGKLLDTRNWRPLCEPCHEEHTRLFHLRRQLAG